ncbi:MAG: CoA transferase [Pararhodobacter sp.]|nr:CoA transferase [Pararhodobacter sp.]
MSSAATEVLGPLTGLKVVDASTIIAAPFAAALLADYGAEVLKLELPETGDGARDFPPFREGKSLWWKVINRNKRFATLDLRRSQARDVFLSLVARHDVLIENFRAGTLDRWGFTREVLWEANPSLVILRVTGFGQTGPYASQPGFARIFEAMGGLTYLTGEPDGEPMHSGYPLADAVGGLFGAASVLAALLAVRADPKRQGEEIDLSLTESTLKLLEYLPIEYDQTGVVRGRAGNANLYSAPSGVFRCRDGCWISMAGSTNTTFAANCAAIGRPDLASNPRFATNSNRVGHSAELNALFRDWFAQNDLKTCLTVFREAGGTIAPIQSIDQIFADPQIQAREAITPVQDDDFGTVRIQNVVPRFSTRPAGHRRTAGSLGRDTEAVLAEIGVSAGQFQALRDAGII